MTRTAFPYAVIVVHKHPVLDPLLAGEKLASFEELLGDAHRGNVSPVFTNDDTDEEKALFESFGPIDAPSAASVGRRHFVKVGARTAVDARRLARRLGHGADVIEAYVEPKYGGSRVRTSTIAESAALQQIAGCAFEEYQLYLNAAPKGLDARYAWSRLGAGRAGKGVNGIDIEMGYFFEHEEFASYTGTGRRVRRAGDQNIEMTDEDHGTACVSIGAAMATPNGVTGFAPYIDLVSCHVVPRYPEDGVIADVIDRAQLAGKRGDVMLIELHAPGETRAGTANLPMEYWPAVFKVISAATAKGIVVVAAAGDGGRSLDTNDLEGRFDITRRDSGAILVGAGNPPSGNFGADRSRWDGSNWGQRIDVQGYGDEVWSAGFGLKWCGAKNDRTRFYMPTFAGTSSAAAIVWGAALLVQSIVVENGRPPLTSIQMRDVLKKTTATSLQTDSATALAKDEHIGPRPDLREALATLGL